MYFAAEPDGKKVRQSEQQYKHARRESCVQVAVCEVDFVSGAGVPDQQREDGDGGDREECEKRGGERKQHTLKQAETFKWEAKNRAAAMLVVQ